MSANRDRGNRRNDSLFRAGLLLAALGVLTLASTATTLWPLFAGLAFSPTHSVPGEFQQQLDEGIYLISVQTSSKSGNGPVSFTRSQAIEVVELSVRDPLGRDMAVGSGLNEFVNRDGDVFSGFGRFTVREPGVYEFRMETSVETNALVTRSLSGFPLRAFVASTIGFAAMVAGTSLLIVGHLRTRNRAEVLPPPLPPPPSF